MYPGIPEYFDIKGRGVYTYLTGSASWVIITMINKFLALKDIMVIYYLNLNYGKRF